MTHVVVEINAGLAEVSLDRPPVNALSIELLAELGAVVEQLRDDDSVKGLLLLGKGRCFSAGLDLKQFAALDAEGLSTFLDVFDVCLGELFCFPKPVAAAVESHAIAGGIVFALAADWVGFGNDDARIGLTELAVGVPFPRGALTVVRAALPPRALNRLVWVADVMSPSHAHALGVGDVTGVDPVAAGKAWLTTATSHPPAAFAVVKRQLRQPLWDDVVARREVDKPIFIETVTSDDSQRAMRAALA